MYSSTRWSIDITPLLTLHYLDRPDVDMTSVVERFQELSKTGWSYEEILKEIEEYHEYSDRERVKFGVLDWADAHSFDVVMFVSVVIRRYLCSVHIQITSFIKYLLILSISVSAVPRRYLGTNTNGITVLIHIVGNVLLSSISDFRKWSQVLVAEVWYLVHWCRLERLTTTLILQRTFVTSLLLPCKWFIFRCILFQFGEFELLVEHEQWYWSLILFDTLTVVLFLDI